MVPCSLKQVNIYFFLLIHLTKEFVLIWPVDLLESVTFFVNRSTICVHMYTWVESSVIFFFVCVYLIIFHRKRGGVFFSFFFLTPRNSPLWKGRECEWDAVYPVGGEMCDATMCFDADMRLTVRVVASAAGCQAFTFLDLMQLVSHYLHKIIKWNKEKNNWKPVKLLCYQYLSWGPGTETFSFKIKLQKQTV